MKLVNIHKLIVFMLLFSGAATAQNFKAPIWSLQQCIDTARVHNKNLQMGENTHSLGRLTQAEAKANLLPKITANADYKYFTNLPYQLMPLSVFGGPEGQFKEAQFGVPHNVGANLQLTMPLYSPQILGTLQSTEIASELSELQRLKTEEQLIFEVTQLYYNAQILVHQSAFADSNLINAGSLLKNIQLLKTQGMARGTDVNKVQLQAEQLTMQKALINSRSAQILNNLKFLMGVPLDTPFDIQSEILAAEPVVYSPLPSLDFRLAQTRNRLLTSELNTLKKSKLPTVLLGGTYGLTGFGYGKQPEPFLKFFPIGYVGVQASYTLWNGTTRKKIAQKNLDLKNSSIQSALIQEQNEMQIANANLQRSATQQSIKIALQQIDLAKAVYEQTVLQQKQGTASLTDILLADNTVREAQQNYLSAMVDFLKADLELKKSNGLIPTIK